MLKKFAEILETFAMDDDALENSGVAVSSIRFDGEDMIIELEDDNGNVETFRISNEV